MKSIIPLTLLLIISWSCNTNTQSSISSKNEPSSSPLGNQIIREATLFAPEIVSQKESDEFGISFTPDMHTLFFTSQKKGDQHFSIYTSSFSGGKWNTATIAPFSGDFFDADAFVTLDGQKIFFFSMRPLKNDTVPLEAPNIWFVEKSNQSWSAPQYLTPNINSPKSGEGYVSLSKNNTIYFSSVGREEGLLHDIYKADLNNGEYGKPVFVDIDIQTNFSNPYISPDEDFIIIDSKEAGGYGGNDLYICYKKNDKWQTPKNLGPLVNTEKDEGTPSITPDGQWFFFSRSGDIYYISASELGLRLK